MQQSHDKSLRIVVMAAKPPGISTRDRSTAGRTASISKGYNSLSRNGVTTSLWEVRWLCANRLVPVPGIVLRQAERLPYRKDTTAYHAITSRQVAGKCANYVPTAWYQYQGSFCGRQNIFHIVRIQQLVAQQPHDKSLGVRWLCANRLVPVPGIVLRQAERLPYRKDTTAYHAITSRQVAGKCANYVPDRLVPVPGIILRQAEHLSYRKDTTACLSTASRQVAGECADCVLTAWYQYQGSFYGRQNVFNTERMQQLITQ
jgi:hypothetical protein